MTTNDPELFIDGVTLKGEAIIKFLGVFSNKNVMWIIVHINTISTKISKSVGIIYSVRLLISRKHEKTINFTFHLCIVI